MVQASLRDAIFIAATSSLLIRSPYWAGAKLFARARLSKFVCLQTARDQHEVIDCNAGTGFCATVIHPKNDSHLIKMAQRGVGRNRKTQQLAYRLWVLVDSPRAGRFDQHSS